MSLSTGISADMDRLTTGSGRLRNLRYSELKEKELGRILRRPTRAAQDRKIMLQRITCVKQNSIEFCSTPREELFKKKDVKPVDPAQSQHF
jgi:hypothetical protein